MAAMQPSVVAGTGFLLAVLWMELMFDVQVRPGSPASGWRRPGPRPARRGDPPRDQSQLARAIHRDHFVCLAAMVTVLAILAWASDESANCRSDVGGGAGVGPSAGLG